MTRTMSTIVARLGLLALLCAGAPGIFHARHAEAQAVSPRGLEGDWQGTMTLPEGRPLRMVLQIREGKDGRLATTLVSLDENASRTPASSTAHTGDAVTVTLPEMDAVYRGKLDPGGDTVAGTLQQSGRTLPLLLARATPETAWTLPEPPRAPKHLDRAVDPTFEVSTVKPTAPNDRNLNFDIDNDGRLKVENFSLKSLISWAWSLHDSQIVGLPAWAAEQHFDLTAVPDTAGLPNNAQMNSELRKLLIERFALRVHTDTRTLTAYRLTVDKGGNRMRPSNAGPDDLPDVSLNGPGQMGIRGGTVMDLANFLQSEFLDHPVVDQTGLGDKRWNFTLHWQMDDAQAIRLGMSHAPPVPETGDAPPPLLTAMPEQLGLRMESGKLPVPVLVIDHVDHPSAN